jgi:putative transposase
MEDYQSLSHTRWQCKYHVIFIPKYRRRALFGVVRRELGNVFRRLAEQKECRIEEGHIRMDHVHMLISIPPKLAVSSVVGYLKGKSAIHVARHVLNRERNYAARASGRGGTSSIRWGAIRRRSAATSKSKTPKTGDSINSSCPA